MAAVIITPYIRVLERIATMLRNGDATPRNLAAVADVISQIVEAISQPRTKLDAETGAYLAGMQSVQRFREWRFEEMQIHIDWCLVEVRAFPDNDFAAGRYEALGELLLSIFSQGVDGFACDDGEAERGI